MYKNLKQLIKLSNGPALYMPGSTQPPTPADIPVQSILPKPKLLPQKPKKLKSLYSPGARQLPQESSLWDAIRDYYTTIPGGPSNAVEQAIKYRPIMAATATPLKQQQLTRIFNKKPSEQLLAEPSGPDLMDPLTFGRTTIQRKYPIKYFSDPDPNYHGYTSKGSPNVYINNRFNRHDLSGDDRRLRKAILEHELTHRTFVPVDNYFKPGPVLHGNDPYLSTPAEVDARLAAIKRLYAKNTGILVDTPEKAEEAINWYRSKGSMRDNDRYLLDEINVMVEPRGVRKGLDPDKLKQNNLDLLKWRMPGLVQRQYPHLQQIIS